MRLDESDRQRKRLAIPEVGPGLEDRVIGLAGPSHHGPSRRWIAINGPCDIQTRLRKRGGGVRQRDGSATRLDDEFSEDKIAVVARPGPLAG